MARAFQEYRLDHSSESELFVVLPKSAEQIRELYQLTILNPPSGHEDLVALYEGYYKAAFNAAPKHPGSFPILFAVAANYGAPLSEGEAPWFCDLLHKLYLNAPDAYLQTLASHHNYRQSALTCAVSCAADTPQEGINPPTFGKGHAINGICDPTENRFTGKERDTESGNDYFGARYYNSNSGRFPES